jgi:hypothetical protein
VDAARAEKGDAEAVTRDELLEKLREFANDDDARCAEADHEHADSLLLEYINDPEVTEAFRAFNKWYA